jgi:hypothetical protein
LRRRCLNTARLVVLAAVWAALLAGCGHDPYRPIAVSGKVMTCEGKPAAGGTVVFYPIDDPASSGRKSGNPGREARGTVSDDGTFSLTTIGMPPAPGAVTGRHRVAFEMPPTRRPTLSGADKENMTPEEIQKNEAEFASRKVYAPIPCSDQMDPDEVTVMAKGPNLFEFKLKPR